MSENLDKRLSAALRPIDPGEDFTARVLQRAAAEAAAPTVAREARRHSRVAWVPAALAASILAVVVVRHEHALRRDEGLAARAQLIEALRLTSGKLDLAFQLVNDSVGARNPAQRGAS